VLELMRDTVKIALENKIFQNQWVAYRQIGFGAGGTAVVLVGLSTTPLPLWLCAAVAGGLGGFAMPYLFKDIKFS